MSHYERTIFTVLTDLHKLNRHPVRTAVLAGFVGKNDRMIRDVLVRLERQRVVQRIGQRGGWMPAPAPRTPWGAVTLRRLSLF